MKEIEFWASMGDVETTKPFRKPSMLRLADFWKEFSILTHYDDFNFYLIGGLAEQKFGAYPAPTWDMDIAVVGEVTDYAKLKDLLDSGYEIGWDNQICMDMFWISDITSPYREEFKPYSIIRNSKTFIMKRGEDVVQQNFTADEEYTLPNSLTQFIWYEPSEPYKKVQRRLENGLYAGVIVDLKDFFG
jgi:hypothetical protein